VGNALPKTYQEPLGKFALSYSGPKRDRYLNAAQQVIHGYSRKDAGVSMMVKWSENALVNHTKLNPDPRAVQFRDPKYCVLLASFIKPMEHFLYELSIRNKLIGTTRLVGKGLNQTQRAKLLVTKLSNFTKPVTLSLDCGRFDKHVTQYMLKMEANVYLKSNNNWLLKLLMSWQLVNKVRTRSGFRYVTNGKRMSGDMNTALGNCIIMIIMVITAFMYIFKIKFDILDDGDDCLVIIEEDNLELVLRDLPNIFKSFGHDLKIDGVAKEIEKISWCQSSPVLMNEGYYKFVRDPIKTMSCDLVSSSFINTDPKVHIRAVGMCELALNSGVPVLQSYANSLLRNAPGPNPVFSFQSSLYLRARRETSEITEVRSRIISIQTRISFEKAFNISVQRQIEMEKHLDLWEINFSKPQYALRSYNHLWELERRTPELY